MAQTRGLGGQWSQRCHTERPLGWRAGVTAACPRRQPEREQARVGKRQAPAPQLQPHAACSQPRGPCGRLWERSSSPPRLDPAEGYRFSGHLDDRLVKG